MTPPCRRPAGAKGARPPSSHSAALAQQQLVSASAIGLGGGNAHVDFARARWNFAGVARKAQNRLFLPNAAPPIFQQTLSSVCFACAFDTPPPSVCHEGCALVSFVSAESSYRPVLCPFWGLPWGVPTYQSFPHEL